MERVLCCALGVSIGLLAGCSHTTPIAKTRAASIAPANKVPNRADLAARIEAVEAEAERAKEAGDNASALHAYRRLLVLDPGHADAHHHLAVAADLEQDFRVAEQHYRAALEREPRNPHLHTSLGWSLFLQHRDGEAVGELRRALELDPEHATALYNMGWLAAHRGDEVEALEYFRRGGTEAQAQALLTKVRLELEDRSSRNQTQRAVARLRAPSPRSRALRNEDSSDSAVQVRAEFEEEGPTSLPRTASLEIAPLTVSERSDETTSPDEDSEPLLISESADQQEIAIRHLAERPAIQTVSHETVSLEDVTAEAKGDESMVDGAQSTLPAVREADAVLGESGSENHSPGGQRSGQVVHQPGRSPSAVRRMTRTTTASSSDPTETSVDLELPQGELVASTTEVWQGLNTGTLATLGRVMLGKPTAARKSGTFQEREVAPAAAGLEDDTSPSISARMLPNSRSRIEPELLNAARMGLNLGQPATRRFYSSHGVQDDRD